MLLICLIFWLKLGIVHKWCPILCRGGGGVKNDSKKSDIIYEWSLTYILIRAQKFNEISKFVCLILCKSRIFLSPFQNIWTLMTFVWKKQKSRWYSGFSVPIHDFYEYFSPHQNYTHRKQLIDVLWSIYRETALEGRLWGFHRNLKFVYYILVKTII